VAHGLETVARHPLGDPAPGLSADHARVAEVHATDDAAREPKHAGFIDGAATDLAAWRGAEPFALSDTTRHD
jgi:hypothetical protein